MKRAAILTAFDPEAIKGGIETFILCLKQLLNKHNIEVDIHHFLPHSTLPIKTFPLKCINKTIPEFLRNCFMMGRAFSEVQNKYDLVISNNFYGAGYFYPRVKSFNIYHSTHIGYADTLKGRIPDNDYRNLKYYFGHIGDRLSGRSKIKIAVSKSVRDELHKYYNFKNVYIVNHGIDITFFEKIEDTVDLRKKWEIPADAFAGVFVGRWEVGKGIDIIEDVIKRHPAITWILVVGNSECKLTSYKNVKVIKDADKETLKEIYSMSDFMLFPSYYEGFGLTIIEAMACNLPVICTEVGIAKELSKFHKLKKLIIPINKLNTVEINNRIAFLKSNENEKKEIAGASRMVIEKYYSLDIWESKMAERLGFLSK